MLQVARPCVQACLIPALLLDLTLFSCLTQESCCPLQACHWAIDELKATIPIWKKEVFEDGEVWKENEEWRQQQRAARQMAAGVAAAGAAAAGGTTATQPQAGTGS